MEGIFLIGGSGRSGTTILGKIMSRHEHIATMPESRFLVDPDGILDFYLSFNSWSPFCYNKRLTRLKKLLKAVSREHPIEYLCAVFYRLGIPGSIIQALRPAYSSIEVSKYCSEFEKYNSELIDQLISFCYRGSWIGSGMFERNEICYAGPEITAGIRSILKTYLYKIFECIVKDQKAKYYLEKNTWNIIWFDKILELIPDAKLVHIYRDPRDVVSSFINTNWMPDNEERAALIFRDLIERWWAVRARVPVNSYIEIAFEDLIRSPKETLNKVYDFLNIAHCDEFSDLKLNKSHMGRWKNETSKPVQNDLNRLLEKQLAHYGYI